MSAVLPFPQGQQISFSEFWQAYPRRVGKKIAERCWSRLKIEEQQAVLESLKLWRQSEDWRDPLYIPHASTFLNQRRWEDEPIVMPKRPRADSRGGLLDGNVVLSASDVQFRNKLYAEHPEIKPADWDERVRAKGWLT